MEPDEFITVIFGRCGNIVDHLGFKTNKGKLIEGGGNGGNSFELVAPNGCHFNTLSGGLGGHLHLLGSTIAPIPDIQFQQHATTFVTKGGQINVVFGSKFSGNQDQGHHHHHHHHHH